MIIFRRRHRFCFIDEEGKVQKFPTLELAKEAGGKVKSVKVSGVPYKVDSVDINLTESDSE